MAFKITVEPKRCVGCETCVENCTQEVFTVKGNKAVVKSSFACIGCRVCVTGCKTKSVTVEQLGNHLSNTIKNILRHCP